MFRGWLCGKCNTGIGLLGDTVEGVKRAWVYMKNKKRATSTRFYRTQILHSKPENVKKLGLFDVYGSRASLCQGDALPLS